MHLYRSLFILMAEIVRYYFPRSSYSMNGIFHPNSPKVTTKTAANFAITAIQHKNQQQNPMQPSHQASASLDSMEHSGLPSDVDWQEEVYQKIQTMKENYLPELNEMYEKLATKLQQRDSLPQHMNPDQIIEKLKIYKKMLERIITFLQVSKSDVLPIFKEKLGSYEKQIINFINTNRPRNAMSSLPQPGQLPLPHMHTISQSHPQITQVQNTSLYSMAQTGQPSGGDWQEEVYQKIQTMKENYLPELNEMYQKIATKIQQQDSLPQQLRSDQIEKLKVFKMMLERIITFLHVSKSYILPSYKDKLGSYEKQIINFISANRPRNAMSSLQQPGQLPPPLMHSMSRSQPQFLQFQSHENQMNSQLQTTYMQGSVTGMPQNSMATSLDSMAQTGQPNGVIGKKKCIKRSNP